MPLNGAPRRYFYNGERVLEELSDSGTMQARYTTENDSYYGQWLHLYRPTGSLSRFPMYDNIGSTRGLLDASGTATDWYELDTFGRQVSSSGTTPNPYRFGAAWGYITDPSGMLQLGQRFYWPEVGRFIQQDPVGHGVNWYAYAEGDPIRVVDPAGKKGSIPPGHILCSKGKYKVTVDCKCSWLPDFSLSKEDTFDNCKDVCQIPPEPELVGPLPPQSQSGTVQLGPYKCTYSVETTQNVYHCKPKPPGGKKRPKPK